MNDAAIQVERLSKSLANPSKRNPLTVTNFDEIPAALHSCPHFPRSLWTAVDSPLEPSPEHTSRIQTGDTGSSVSCDYH